MNGAFFLMNSPYMRGVRAVDFIFMKIDRKISSFYHATFITMSVQRTSARFAYCEPRSVSSGDHY